MPTQKMPVHLLGRPLSFNLDIGAEFTTISKSVFGTLPQVKLRPPNRTLYGPSRIPLLVLRQFEGTLSHSDQMSIQMVFVIKELKNNPLGCPSFGRLLINTYRFGCSMFIDGDCIL